MHIGPQGLALVKAFESCLKPDGLGQFRPYLCPAGVLTIGWGHTNVQGRQFDQNSRWSQAECDAELTQDMLAAETSVQRRVRVPLEQPQYDALVSFTFNCGEGNLSKSTLLKKLNASDYDGAAREFKRWNRGSGRVLNGLTRRRTAEEHMFRGAQNLHPFVNDKVEGATPMVQDVDAPSESMATSKIGNTQIGVGVASGVGALGQLNEALSTASTTKTTVHDLGVTDVLAQLAHQPTFWIFAGVALAAGLTWYWRRQHRQAGV